MEREDILAIYTRTSLEDFDKAHRLIDQSYSIVSQRNLIAEYVHRHKDLSDMPQIEYIDDGFTGTNFDRPRFQEMLEAVRQGKVKCIIFKDFSRLGRSYLEVGDYLEKIFPTLDVRLISVTDGYDSKDYDGITGGLDIAFRNFIYDSYSKDLSTKVKTAMRMRMENGKFVNHTPYGYMKSPKDKHQMIPDPETAPIVREIFLMVIAGKTTTEVAKELNRRGVLTPLQYKKHRLKPSCQDRELIWSHVMVINVLKNYKYTGAMVNNIRESRKLRDRNQRRTAPEEWIITEGAHEAIVTKEEYEAAHANLRHPSKFVQHRGNPTDRVFFCGCCGRKLRKGLGANPTYCCDTPMYQEDAAACRGVRWEKAALEATILPVYGVQMKLLGEQAETIQQSKAAMDIRSFIRRMAKLEKDINNCDTQKLSLFEAYHDHKIDREELLAGKEKIVQAQADLRAEYAQAEEQYARMKQSLAQQQEEQERIQQFLAGSELPDEMAIEKMYEALDRVLIFDGEHIEIRWKFEDLFRPQPLSSAKKLVV